MGIPSPAMNQHKEPQPGCLQSTFVDIELCAVAEMQNNKGKEKEKGGPLVGAHPVGGPSSWSTLREVLAHPVVAADAVAYT